MNKAKIKSNLISFGVAFLVALVICSAVVAVHFLIPQNSAFAEVSSIESNVMYVFEHTIASGEGNVLPSSNRAWSTIGYDCSPYIYLNDIVINPTPAGYFYLQSYTSAQSNSTFGSYYGVYGIGGNGQAVKFYIGANNTLVGVSLNYSGANTNPALPPNGYYAINDVDFSIKIYFYNWRDPDALSAYFKRFLIRTLSPDIVPDPIVVSSDYYNSIPDSFESITSAGNFNCSGSVYFMESVYAFTSISVSAGSTVQDIDVIFNDSSNNAVAGWSDGAWFCRTPGLLPLYPYVGDARVVFSSAGNISGKYLYNLNQIISTPILPIFGSIIDIYQELPVPVVQDSLEYVPTTNRLRAVELVNASDFATSRTNASGTYYYVPVYYNDTMSSTWSGVTWAFSDGGSQWWLLFAVPINVTYNVRLSYYRDMHVYTELSYVYDPNEGMDDVLAAFVGNYRNTTYGLDIAFRTAFEEGESAGYDAGYADNNSLISVFWAAFEFPFRIFFGSYNTNTGLYEGGLFNFTILGLDIRAFVLSIISVCLVIAIIKLIIGARGGGSNG